MTAINPTLYNYISSLESMSLKDLQALWFEHFKEKTKAINKNYLINHLAYKIQADKYGGLSKRTKDMIAKKIKENSTQNTKTRTHTIKPGTELTKIYKNVEFRVTATEDGFEFNGLTYRSLTKIAHIITGQKISGPRFFELKN